MGGQNWTRWRRGAAGQRAKSAFGQTEPRTGNRKQFIGNQLQTGVQTELVEPNRALGTEPAKPEPKQKLKPAPALVPVLVQYRYRYPYRYYS